MWWLKDTPALFTDLYELTMAQVYFQKKMDETASFEVTVRRLPENWGFFVMAGLAEVEAYLNKFIFTKEDIKYLSSTGIFTDDFLKHLERLRFNIKVRALPEGTVFFPNEPILEVNGPLIHAQLLESYLLNILGFSIIEATLAARIVITAKGLPVIDFGLRRCQGPIASVRSVRAAQIAGFKATSNVFAAKELDFAPSGTMAHSFVQVHESEEAAFVNFANTYGADTILLVDTYDCAEGIKTAANVAKKLLVEKGIRLKGIRIDSGDLAELSRFARRYFAEQEVSFLKIFVSGDLDEFKILDLLEQGAEVDGLGIGTRFAVSKYAPYIEIIYKIVQYGNRALFKTSPDKHSRPGRKSLTRIKDGFYKRDVVYPFGSETNDLLRPFESSEKMPVIQQRLAGELSLLHDSVKAIRSPQQYPVEFGR